MMFKGAVAARSNASYETVGGPPAKNQTLYGTPLDAANMETMIA